MNSPKTPMMVEWLLTDLCNLRCVYCSSWDLNRSHEELSTEDALKLLDKMAELQIFSLTLSGGEPLCRKDIYLIVKHASDLGIRVSIPTNGYFVNATTAKKLVESNPRSIQVSVDGANAETHDSLRGVQGSFTKAINAVKYFKDTGFERINISTTVTKTNYDEVPEIVDMALELGAFGYSIRVCMPCGKARGTYEQLRVTPNQWKKMLEYLVERRRTLGDSLDFHSIDPLLVVIDPSFRKSLPLFDEQNFSGCGSGNTGCAIWPDGKVTPCAYIDEEAGNIHNQPLEEIWQNSEVFTKYREWNKTVSGVCKQCDWTFICAGGCKSRSYGSYGISSCPDPMCWIAHGESGEGQNG